MSNPALSDDAPRCELCDWPIEDANYLTCPGPRHWLYAHVVCVEDERELTGEPLSEWARLKRDEP